MLYVISWLYHSLAFYAIIYKDMDYVYLQVAESKLAKFVEDIIVPPRMIDIIIDGEVLSPFVTWFCIFKSIQ